MKGDTNAAVEFLRRFRPDGPWVLTSIDPDRKGIETKTFLVDQIPVMQAWIESSNGRRNLYFTVNPPRKVVTKKPEREDIASLDWLHVDIDPRAGEDLAQEQERIRGVLTAALPATVPAPTAIVFTGGGYQAFWRLREPLRLDGTEAEYEHAKRYNLQLELLFGADSCHNIDRVMRLPGTVNVPDAKKRKKGRVEALAAVVSFEDHVYDLSQFTPAPLVQSPDLGFDPGGGGTSLIKVEVKSGNVQRLADINELDEWGVSDRLKIIAVQGNHPDEPAKASRSEWLFDFVCNCLRAGVPDEVVFSIITDPNFGIANSVVDKGSNAEKYALKQIRDAKEFVIEPWLRKLNARHAIIRNVGGKCRVIEEVNDPTFNFRARLTKQSFDDFRNAYMHIMVECGKKPDGSIIHKPLGKWWLEHPMRRQFDYIVFSPEREGEGAYNLWRGFACEARPGDCSLFLEHIKVNVCDGREDYYTYIMGWMARAVQQPGSPGHTAIVLRGGQGTGKSFFAKTFGSLFGRHFLQVSNPSHLVGNFNSHLRDCIVLFGDEAFYAGDKRHESVLKTLITEETLAIEAKGVDVETSPNFTHIILASNHLWVVPANADERRFLVLDVSPAHKQDTTYFKRVADQMEHGGREALLHYLMTYDLSGFNVRAVPKTRALEQQKLFSLGPEEEWWYRKLVTGVLTQEAAGWTTQVRSQLLTEDYVDYTRAFNVTRRGNETILGYFLRSVLPEGWPKSFQKKARVRIFEQGMEVEKEIYARFYRIPTLPECRAAWEHKFGACQWEEPARLEEEPARDIPF